VKKNSKLEKHFCLILFYGWMAVSGPSPWAASTPVVLGIELTLLIFHESFLLTPGFFPKK
jgi:hypothetical protein